MNNVKTSETLISTPSELAKEICSTAISNRDVTESERKLAPSIIEELKNHQLFKMALPKHLGGWEGNPVETLKVYETLASAETSVAWIVWNNHLACTFGRFLNNENLNEIYKNPNDVYANSTRPEGVAKIIEGGYMVSGRWSLVSGCELADWFVLRCLVTGGDLPTKLGPGAKLKLMYVPKDKVKVIDTWNVGGLRGTGSHDIEIEDTFVKDSYAVDFESHVENDSAYNRLPIGAINSSGCAAMALGLLKGAIDELTKMCLERVTPGKNPDLRDRLTVQMALAKAKTILAAHRTQLHHAVNIIWEESLKENSFTDVQLADVWAASYEAATAARTMVSEIYAVAGTSSLYSKFRIERIHRDIYAVLQHGIIQPHWMNQAGMAYVGLKPTAAMFRI
ncbi:acyl-CoA dehydrogenase family protein [Maribacter dokdonensis]|uniref:acyl-CoA dehydrogenase family protein n=1 Tax=Maribacter dokdonensis TaxID=320912 RepID=UPI003299129E